LNLSEELQDRVANKMSELKTRILAYSFEGITDIEIGPDGNIYILVLYQGT
jgi:hypothetical protein